VTMPLRVRDVLRSPQPFQRGKHSLGVFGLLVVRPGDCRIIDDEGAVDDLGRAIVKDWAADRSTAPPTDEASIRIDGPAFLPRLMAEIPPVGDAEYLYFDNAIVCGWTRLDPGEVVLHDIWDVFLVRDGERLRALGEPRLG
jgi:hypothetical protein